MINIEHMHTGPGGKSAPGQRSRNTKMVVIVPRGHQRRLVSIRAGCQAVNSGIIANISMGSGIK